jgi:hypothetical protein
MTRKFIPLWTALCAMLLLMSASPVHAQATLWVADFGADSNPCSEASPCLTFQGAIGKGNVGQINCMTSGDYGPVTITNSITIDCGTGNVGIIELAGGSPTGNAITLNTSTQATVVLRHLSLQGFHNPAAVFGISTQSFPSGTLVLDHCTIQGFAGFGITFLPSGGRGLLQVSNSQFLDNFGGIAVQPSNGQIVSVALSGVALVANSSVGISLGGAGVAAGTMRNSIVAENPEGIFANATQVFFTIEESSIVANTSFGIRTNSAGAVFNVGATTFGANALAMDPRAGSIISFGNNLFSANAADGNFTGIKALK